MFTRRKKRKAVGKKAKKPEEMSSGSDGDSSSDSDEEDGEDLGRATTLTKDDDGKEWGKKVDEVQREYISTNGCRTAVSDKHFNNPPRDSQSKDNKWGLL